MMTHTVRRALIQKNWYIQGINASPSFLYAGPASGLYYMGKRLGVSYTDFIMVNKRGYIELYYDRKDLASIADTLLKRYFENPRYLNTLRAMTAADRAPFFARSAPLHGATDNLSRMSNRALVREYRICSRLFHAMFATSHAIEPLALTTDEMLKDMIAASLKKRGRQSEFASYFSTLTQTTDDFYLNAFNRELIQIFSAIKKQPRLLKLFQKESVRDIVKRLKKEHTLYDRLTRHVSKYYWINTTWRGRETYGEREAVALLQRISREEEEVQSTQERVFARNRERKRRLIQALKLEPKVARLIHLTDMVAKWQDDRKRDMLRGTWILDTLLSHIADRFRIPHHLLRYLLPEETSPRNLRDASLPALLKKRQTFSVYLFYKRSREVTVGRQARAFVGRVAEKKGALTKELTGISASSGKAVGRVRICLTPKEADAIGKGDILVTTMTRPEFVRAMKRAGAVVTDEGGLTSHAAIIARELGIPCIIGTKYATKRLKEGSVVEVNANHGVVKVVR